MPGSRLFGFFCHQLEKRRSDPLASIAPTDVQEFQLERVILRAYELTFQYRRADQTIIFKRTPKRPATLIAVQ